MARPERKRHAFPVADQGKGRDRNAAWTTSATTDVIPSRPEYQALSPIRRRIGRSNAEQVPRSRADSPGRGSEGNRHERERAPEPLPKGGVQEKQNRAAGVACTPCQGRPPRGHGEATPVTPTRAHAMQPCSVSADRHSRRLPRASQHPCAAQVQAAGEEISLSPLPSVFIADSLGWAKCPLPCLLEFSARFPHLRPAVPAVTVRSSVLHGQTGGAGRPKPDGAAMCGLVRWPTPRSRHTTGASRRGSGSARGLSPARRSSSRPARFWRPRRIGGRAG